MNQHHINDQFAENTKSRNMVPGTLLKASDISLADVAVRGRARLELLS